MRVRVAGKRARGDFVNKRTTTNGLRCPLCLSVSLFPPPRSHSRACVRVCVCVCAGRDLQAAAPPRETRTGPTRRHQSRHHRATSVCQSLARPRACLLLLSARLQPASHSASRDRHRSSTSPNHHRTASSPPAAHSPRRGARSTRTSPDHQPKRLPCCCPPSLQADRSSSSPDTDTQQQPRRVPQTWPCAPTSRCRRATSAP